MHPTVLGLGIGWRPELALAIDRHPGLDFIELVAEDFDPLGEFPLPIRRWIDRGRTVIPHGVSLSLGGADPPSPARLDALARLAERTHAPLVSEHLAFVRAGNIETGHLLPVQHSREMLELVIDNVNRARAALPVPLALENIATLFEWPGAEMEPAEFLRIVLNRTDSLLLLDVENVYANALNDGSDAEAFLDRLPLERLAYVHVAGGLHQSGIYHDTHTRPVPRGVLDLLSALAARVAIPGVMLERDDNFPSEPELYAELESIRAAVERGRTHRETAHALE